MPSVAVTVPADTVTGPNGNRRRRYRLQGSVQAATALDRVAGCMSPLSASVAIKVAGSGSDRSAYFAGIKTCGSVWACPICSAKIRQRRAEDLRAGVERWMLQGNSVAMVTVTLPHQRHHRLGVLLEHLVRSFSRVRAGRWLSEERRAFGIAGIVKAVEVTYGEHGWHPHLHVLVFFRGHQSPAGVDRVRRRWFQRLDKASRDAGLGPLHPVHGVDAVLCTEPGEVGPYVVKVQDGPRLVHLEMTRHDLKAGRVFGSLVPFQLAEMFTATGDRFALDLWREYESVTRGRAMLTWSHGLRDLLALGAEATDEQVAAEDVGGDVWMMLDASSYRLLRRAGVLPVVLEYAEAAQDPEDLGGFVGLLLLRLTG